MNLKLIGKIGYWVIIAFIAIVAGVVAVSALNLPQGINLYTVQSGSMEPAVSLGSLVVVKPQESYQEGDVVTYKSKQDIDNPDPENTTTHRIVEVQEEDGEVQYVTKGDANESPDSDPVVGEQIIGKVNFRVPLIGRVVNFAQTREGLIILIIIPAVIIVYSELLSIKREVVGIYKEMKKKSNKEESNAGKRRKNKNEKTNS